MESSSPENHLAKVMISEYRWDINDGIPKPCTGVAEFAPQELLKVVACGCSLKVLRMQVPVLEIRAHASQLAYHVPPFASAKHKKRVTIRTLSMNKVPLKVKRMSETKLYTDI